MAWPRYVEKKCVRLLGWGKLCIYRNISLIQIRTFGRYGGEYEDGCFPVYSTVQYGRSLPSARLHRATIIYFLFWEIVKLGNVLLACACQKVILATGVSDVRIVWGLNLCVCKVLAGWWHHNRGYTTCLCGCMNILNSLTSMCTNARRYSCKVYIFVWFYPK
jgi:hypothetical protein